MERHRITSVWKERTIQISGCCVANIYPNIKNDHLGRKQNLICSLRNPDVLVPKPFRDCRKTSPKISLSSSMPARGEKVDKFSGKSSEGLDSRNSSLRNSFKIEAEI